ncbi:hypothetical protein JKP88DRAFT_240792 [Tribonema minus]|uniref:Uncharacterized protein n=1 Tax=Tribonema minus TaxID=303371 RepID=A0A835ZGA2_9STRA|nr:hypothetical protein JKP88DRAFT_240792 [Tribonema minus]
MPPPLLAGLVRMRQCSCCRAVQLSVAAAAVANPAPPVPPLPERCHCDSSADPRRASKLKLDSFIITTCSIAPRRRLRAAACAPPAGVARLIPMHVCSVTCCDSTAGAVARPCRRWPSVLIITIMQQCPSPPPVASHQASPPTSHNHLVFTLLYAV